MRIDYDCEAIGFLAERWGETVFKIKDEEIVFEICVEEKVIVSIMAGEGAKEINRKSTGTSVNILIRQRDLEDQEVGVRFQSTYSASTRRLANFRTAGIYSETIESLVGQEYDD